MDYTALFSTLLLTLLAISPQASHSETSRDASTRTKTQGTPDIHRRGTDSTFSVENKDAVQDREFGKKFYGPGYYILKESNGCGGNIVAWPGYQYGHLVSPNWPMPYPVSIQCHWSLQGFDHIIIYFTEFDLRPISHCYVDRLSLYFPKASLNITSFPSVKNMCGGDLAPRDKMIVATGLDPEVSITVTFTAFASTVPERTGFVLTWMKFPQLDFVTELLLDPVQVPDEKAKTAYFIHVGSMYETIEAHVTIIMNVTTAGGITYICRGFHAAIVDVGHTMRQDLSTTCGPKLPAPAGRTQIKAEVSFKGSSKARAPWVLEITKPDSTKISTVNITYLRHKTVPFPCEMMEGSVKGNGIYGIFLPLNSSQNANGTSCGILYRVPVANLWDSFIQVRANIVVEESPSCLSDYMLVGGRRICGHGVQQLVSPSANMILERVGGRYLNILQKELLVTASRVAVSFAYELQTPMNTIETDCYRSHPKDTNVHWTVTLRDVFLIYGLEITTERPSFGVQQEDISVYMNEGDETFSVKCWSGFIVSGASNHIMCSSPLYARFVKIRKQVNLTLCHIQVFINIAEPNLAAMNVARDKVSMLTWGSPLNAGDYKWGVPLTDGERSTCFESPEGMPRPFITVDLTRVYRVFAVRVVTSVNSTTSHMLPRKFNVMVYPMTHKYTESQLCRYIEKLTRDNTLINCQQPLNGHFVDLEQEEYPTYICELLVYAFHDVLDRNNIALRKTAKAYFNRSIENEPVFNDGNLGTCVEATEYLKVDLGALYYVTEVLVTIGWRTDLLFHVRIMGHESFRSDDWVDCETKDKLYVVYKFETMRIVCHGPRMGQYVAVLVGDNQRTNLDQFTSICEIQVLGVPHVEIGYEPTAANLVNVALYKYAVTLPYGYYPNEGVQTDSGDVVRTTARMAVDGSLDTYVSHCRPLYHKMKDLWWIVDLGNVFTVSMVIMTMCELTKAKDDHYRVDLYTYNPELYMFRDYPNSECTLMQFVVKKNRLVGWAKCPQNTRGRYATVMKMNAVCMCLLEVEVLARPLVSARRFGVNPTPGSTINWEYNIHFTLDKNVAIGWLDFFYGVNDLTKFKSLVDCKEMVHLDNSTIPSPNYPENYANDDDNYVCQWMVHTPFDGFTVVSIHHLNLATHPDFPYLCFGDILLLSNEVGQQEVLCGHVNPQEMNTYTFQAFKDEYLTMTLLVRTPETSKLPMNRSHASGFQVWVRSYPTCYRVRLRVGIGGRRGKGIISSPLYPSDAPPNAQCRWSIIIYHEGFVQLYFRDFSILGGDKHCLRSFVSIKTKTQTLTYCNANPPGSGYVLNVGSGDKITVIFKSEQTWPGRGFQLGYRFDTDSDNHRFGLLHYRREAVALGDGTATRSVSTGQQYTTRLPATWIFSSLANAGRFVLTVPFIPDSERSGNCSKYLSIQTENVRTGRKVYHTNTCQESYDVSPFTTWTIDLRAADLPRDRNFNFTFSFQTGRHPPSDDFVRHLKVEEAGDV